MVKQGLNGVSADAEEDEETVEDILKRHNISPQEFVDFKKSKSKVSFDFFFFFFLTIFIKNCHYIDESQRPLPFHWGIQRCCSFWMQHQSQGGHRKCKISSVSTQFW